MNKKLIYLFIFLSQFVWGINFRIETAGAGLGATATTPAYDNSGKPFITVFAIQGYGAASACTPRVPTNTTGETFVAKTVNPGAMDIGLIHACIFTNTGSTHASMQVSLVSDAYNRIFVVFSDGEYDNTGTGKDTDAFGSCAISSFTPAVDNSLVIIAIGDNATFVHTPPAGYTEQSDISGGGGMQGAIATLQQTAKAATAPTYTTSSNNVACGVWTIKPVASPGGTELKGNNLGIGIQ